MDLERLYQEHEFDRVECVTRHEGLAVRLNETNVCLERLEHRVENIETRALEAIKLEAVDIESNDVILLKFPFEDFDINVANEVYELLKSVFADNIVVMVPKGCELNIYSREEIMEIEPATIEELHNFLNS